MVRLVPPFIKSKRPTSEKILFEAFQKINNRDDWVVFHSQKASTGDGQLRSEVDFLVLIPEKGFVFIEAKGASRVSYTDDEWTMNGVAENARHKDPFKQIDSGIAGVRIALKNAKFDVRDIPMARLVWFTKISSSEASIDSTGTGFFDWELAWHNDLGSIVGIIEKTLNQRFQIHRSDRKLDLAPKKFSGEFFSQVTQSLSGSFSAQVTAVKAAKLLQTEQAILAKEHKKLLAMVAKNNGVFFEGAAGTGKTQILKSAAVSYANEGRNVLYCCFNEMLAEHMQSELANHSRVVVRFVNKLLREIAGIEANKDDPNWYDVELPKLAIKAIRKNPNLVMFDAICIDEFQDLAPRPLIVEAVLKLARKSPREPVVLIAGDDGQQIFIRSQPADSWKVAEELVPGVASIQLATNVRQPPELCRAILELLGKQTLIADHRIEPGSPWSLNVLPTKEETKTVDLARVLRKLVSLYPGLQIRVLSPLAMTSTAGKFALRNRAEDAETYPNGLSEELAWLDENLKSDGNAEGQIKWRSISKFKGLEDQIVVITDISDGIKSYLAKNNRSLEEQLYVGATRANQHLVILVEDNLLPKTMTVESFMHTKG